MSSGSIRMVVTICTYTQLRKHRRCQEEHHRECEESKQEERKKERKKERKRMDGCRGCEKGVTHSRIMKEGNIRDIEWPKGNTTTA